MDIYQIIDIMKYANTCSHVVDFGLLLFVELIRWIPPEQGSDLGGQGRIEAYDCCIG